MIGVWHVRIRCQGKMIGVWHVRIRCQGKIWQVYDMSDVKVGYDM